MHRFTMLRHYLIATLCLGFLLPHPLVGTATAATPQVRRIVSKVPQVTDVRLGADGLLTGRVVDKQGQGLNKLEVFLLRDQKVISSVKTDQDGHFRVVGLSGGIYHLMADEAVTICRAWSDGTAPPSARAAALLVADKKVTAGQYTPLGRHICNPHVLGAIVAVAVAVPVIIHNNRADRDFGS